MGVLGETTVTFMKRFSFRSVLSGKPFRTAETPPDEVILSGKSSKVAKKEPKTASKSLQGIKLNCFRSKAGRLANRTDFREEWLIGRTDPVPSLEKDGKTQSLSLTEVYKPYHDRGITGDTEKVMVFDSGLPRRNLELKKKAFFKFDGQAFQEDHSLSKRGDSHAEAVTHILSQALPDAEFIFYGTAHPPEDFEIFKKHGVSQIAYLKGRQKITYELYKELLYSRLQNYKKAIIHGVNQGATLINMSLGLDYMTARLKDYNREELLAALKGDKILKPWQEALDYAKNNNVQIFIASGNDGMHSYLEPLLAIPHPTLKIIGSTDEMAGNIATSSSRLSKDNPPNFCASGAGDLYALPKKKLGFFKRVKQNHSGTSFASPDAAGTFGISQCGRQHQGLPRFTIEDGKFDQVVHKNIKPVSKAKTPQVDKIDISEELEKKLEEQKPQEPNEADPWEIQEESFAQHKAFLDKKKALLDYTFSSSGLEIEALERKYPEFKKWFHEIMEQKEVEIAKLRAGHGTIAGRRRKIVDAALEIP